MKNLFSRMPKKVLVVLGSLVATFGIAAAATAWFPERPTYTIENPAPHVTFNSITNNPNEGDERAFFELKDATNTQPNGFSHTMNDLKGGQELLLRMYVHNNAADNLNTVPDGQGGFKGIARNTKVRVFLPTATDQTALRANAYISADNATPREVADTINLGGSTPFGVEYVPGSAVIHTNAVPAGMALSDSIVTTGAPIGYNQLDGKMPGCFQYSAIVTIKVKVKAPRYTIAKQVRFAGQTAADWKESVTAKPGDKLEWSIKFRNTGSTQLKDVKIVDEVPTGVNVVPGSIVMYDANFPNGYRVPDSAIQANGRQLNIGIGNHNPLPAADIASGKVSSQIIFATTVAPIPQDKCEDLKLTNKAFVTPQGGGSIWDTAEVIVTNPNECKEPETPTYDCVGVTLTNLGNRKVRVSVNTSVTNGATVKSYSYNFGDGKAPLVTDQNPVEYTFDRDGNFVVRVQVSFNVNGQTKTIDSDKCAAPITFTAGQPTPPTTPTPTTPTQLPSTGAGDIAGMFAAVSVAGATAHKLVWTRRSRG